MLKTMLIRCAFLVAFAASAALAADVTGNWTGQINGPDGNGFTLIFHFQQDGSKLTGSVEGPGGEPLQIKDGKAEGDKITFTIIFNGGGGDMKILHEGTVKGDEISLNTKMEDGGAGPAGGPIVLKRSK